MAQSAPPRLLVLVSATRDAPPRRGPAATRATRTISSRQRVIAGRYIDRVTTFERNDEPRRVRVLRALGGTHIDAHDLAEDYFVPPGDYWVVMSRDETELYGADMTPSINCIRTPWFEYLVSCGAVELLPASQP